MDIQQIRYFLELSKELHFWNTAEKMFITQSALSRQIKSLEEELGIQLFERNKRNVKLTAAGSFLRDEWKRMLEEISSVHRHAKQIHEGKYGSITIGYPGSIAYGFLPELMGEIGRKLPELKVELIEPEDTTFESMLLNYQMDLALRREASGNPALQSICLYSENLTLIVPSKHALTQAKFKKLSQLKDEKFILSGLHHNTYYVATLNEIFNEYKFTPKVHIESDFGSTVMSLVAKGLGVSIMPGSYEFGKPRGVRFIKLPYETRLYATWRKDDNNPALKNTLELAKRLAPRFREKPGSIKKSSM